MATSSNVRNLLGVLFAQHPDIVVGERFLDRTMIAEGLCFSSPNLRDLFGPFGDMEAGVHVRDGGTGERVGLVVFSDSIGCSAATSAPTLPGCYRRLLQASSICFDPDLVEQSIRDLHLRRPIAERLASTLPPSYFDGHAEVDFHLRCIFLKVTATHFALHGQEICIQEDGALYAYYVVRDVLSATGDVSAVIMCERTGVATVVFDDAADTECVSRTSSRLFQSGIGVYDSSLFPICAGSEGVDRGGPMLRLLPAFCHHGDYRGRVVIFKGFDTMDRHRDAGVITEGVQRYMESFHRLQALLIHRADGLVVAVLGSRDEALALIQEPEESWVHAFGQVISCGQIDAGQFPTKLRALAPEFVPHPDVLNEAKDTMGKWIQSYLRRCAAADDTKGIVIGLIAGIAMSKPHIIRATRFGGFADRAVLLVGVAGTITKSQLRAAMFPIGPFDECSLYRDKGVALVIFRDASLAARVLSEPMARWVGTGFNECLPAPGAEEASKIAEKVLCRRLQIIDWAYLGRRWADGQEQRETCVRILELLEGDVSDLP